MMELSELLMKKLDKDRRYEIAEYISNHPREFEKVLNHAFLENSDLKKPLLDIVDLLNGTQMILVIEQAVSDEDVLIRKHGLQAAYRTRVDSLNVQVAEILSNKEEEFEVRKWALHILASSDPEYYSGQIVKITRDRARYFKLKGITNWGEQDEYLQLQLAETGFSDLKAATV